MECDAVAERELSDLVRFRDGYLAANAGATVADRERALADRIAVVLHDVPLASSGEAAKLRNWLVRGRVLNVLDGYDARCEDYLTRAVKMAPDAVDAWNELGKCLWKKPDYDGAAQCFATAIDTHRNKLSLRSLSLLKRLTLPHNSDHESRAAAAAESVRLARDAVELDRNDAESHCVLGNAHFVRFFASAQRDAGDLFEARRAYETAIALGDEDASYSSPELHYNYAQALRYDQDYAECVRQLRRAVALDADFAAAGEERAELARYLRAVHRCVARKGGLRPKRIAEMASTFEQKADVSLSDTLRLRIRTDKDGRVQLERRTLQQCKEGLNEGTLLVAKVLAPVPCTSSVPNTSAAMDERGDVFALAVYNCTERFGLCVGQTVAVAEPFLIDVSVQFESDGVEAKGDEPTSVDYRCVRVSSPQMLLVNGRPLPNSHVALAVATASVH